VKRAARGLSGYGQFMDGDLEVRPGVVVAGHELEWSYTTSGGPGGQHANRSRTKVVLKLNLSQCQSLRAQDLTQLRERLGDVVTVEVEDQRSQWQNRRVARERMKERLLAGLHRPKKRRPTKPSRGAQRRRLQAKKQRSETKKQRRKPTMD